MKEVMIISDLKHPNIVLYMGICITADKFILVTEYLENGSLFDQLHKKHKKFTEVEKIEIAYEIVKGMVYLHNMKNLLHRDLKSSNVLIGEDWNVVKLCDFGLSGQKKKRTKHTRVGTYQWMAPEVVRNEKKVDEKSDVYSFGVILWELLTEKVPYQGLT
jgi:serine/threonine protein kinase